MSLELAEGIVFLVLGIAILAAAIVLVSLAPGNSTARAFLWYATASGVLWLIWSAELFNQYLGFDFWNVRITDAILRVVFTAQAMVPAFWLLFVGRATELGWMLKITRTPIVGSYLALALVSSQIIWTVYLTEFSSIRTAYAVVQVVVVATALVAILAAWQARTSAPKGTSKRRRMAAYLLAFVVHDLGAGMAYLSYLLSNFDAIGSVVQAWITVIALGAVILVFMPLLLYGSLNGLILDIDRRFHLGISRTTVAAFFVAVFVGVQTVVSEFAAASWGLAAAGVSAAVLFFALTPLQKIGERIADKAMPSGGSPKNMNAAERNDFYREQVEIAYSDGVIGSKERNSLKSVRERIGLSAAAALKIEDTVVSG